MLTLSNTDSINNTGIKCLSWTFVHLIKSQKQTWLKEHQGPNLDASLMEVQLLYCNLTVLSYPSLASKREREKETLVGSGHESPEQNLCWGRTQPFYVVIQAQEGLAVCRPKAVPSFVNPNNWPCESADWANPALVKKSITSQKQSKSAIKTLPQPY